MSQLHGSTSGRLRSHSKGLYRTPGERYEITDGVRDYVNDLLDTTVPERIPTPLFHEVVQRSPLGAFRTYCELQMLAGSFRVLSLSYGDLIALCKFLERDEWAALCLPRVDALFGLDVAKNVRCGPPPTATELRWLIAAHGLVYTTPVSREIMRAEMRSGDQPPSTALERLDAAYEEALHSALGCELASRLYGFEPEVAEVEAQQHGPRANGQGWDSRKLPYFTWPTFGDDEPGKKGR